MHAVGRIAYRGAIDNIQISWVKMGADGVRQILRAGVNDLGGTLMDENISRAAGASHGQMMDAERFAALVEPLGRPLAQRTTLYGRVDGPRHPKCSPPPTDGASASAPTRRTDPSGPGPDVAESTRPAGGHPAAGRRHPGAQRRLYRSMLETVAGLAGDQTDVIDLKVADTALAEMAEAFRVFRPFRRERKVTFFGSARTEPDASRLPLQARRPGRSAWPAADWMVVTGAGPGIMAAGMEGAGREQVHRREHPAALRAGGQPLHRPGPQAGRDAVLLHPQAHAHQGVRRLRRAARRVRHPGRGLRAPHPAPDGQGRAGPRGAARRPRRHLLEGMGRVPPTPTVEPRGLVSPDDRSLFLITDDVDVAAAEILGFYRNYHSCRWVGDLLVMRMLARSRQGRSWPSSTREFADIVASGVDPPVQAPRSRAVRRRPPRPRPAGASLRQDPLRAAPPAHRRPQRAVD